MAKIHAAKERRIDGRGVPGVLAWASLAVVLQSFVGPVLVAQQVTLPLPEYRSLRARAFPPPEPPPEPPAPTAFESAALDVAVGDASARVTYTLDVALYGQGWQSLPLPAVGSFVAADFGAIEGRIAEGSERSVLVRGEGVQRLTLEAVLPLERDESATRPTWRLDLGLPSAAVVSGVLRAGDLVKQVEASDGAVVTPLSIDGSGGGWSFVGTPGGVAHFVLSGEATVPERSLLPLRFEATSATALGVSHTRLGLHAWIGVRVLQGELSRLDLPLPEGFEVVAVDGESVAGWDLESEELRITPLVPVRDSFAVAVELAGPPETELPSPVVAPTGAVRSLIATKVGVEGDGLLTLIDPGAGRRPDARQGERLPQVFLAAPGEPFLVAEGEAPPRWRVTWAEGTQVLAAQVDRLLVHYLVGEAGSGHLELWATVRNTGTETLSLELPPGAELLTARRDGVALVPGRGPGGWVVPLSARSGPQIVYVAALVPVALPEGAGELSLALPKLSAPASRVEVRLALPPGRGYRLADGARAGSAGPPAPATAARQEVSTLSRQLLGSAAGAAAEWVTPAPVPPGYATVEAAWSALSSAPPPVVVQVERERGRWRWQ